MTVIAIDGPAGAGKSSVARAVARSLGLRYVDTGAMYRVVALAVLEQGVDPTDEVAVAAVAEGLEISVGDGTVSLEGRDLGDEIRTGEVTRTAALVAQHPSVRRVLVDIQRRLGRTDDVVMEGRDIGTAVMPDAEVKVFLTASLEERARRRAREHGLQGSVISRLREEIERRDHRDETRSQSPLTRADDAIVLDTTEMSPDDVVEAIKRLALPFLDRSAR